VAWQDRVREGAYTPPSGIRMTFLYEDLSREVDKRTAIFRFASVDGGYVQDNGFSERRYPLRCIFAGPSHDLAATAFELALLERGVGRLDHPFYGSFDAIPFGTITRRDDLKSAANQSIIEVTFFATLGALYPSQQTSPRNELLAALDAFDAAAAEQFNEVTDLSTAAARAATATTTRGLLQTVSAAIGGIADGVATVSHAFRDAQAAVNYGVDVLVGQPLQLALQVTNLVRAPAIARVGLQSRLDGYRQLAQSIFGSTALTTLQSAALSGLQLRLTNGFHTADLFAASAVTGALRSCIEEDFTSKPEALNAASDVLSQFDAFVAWHENAFQTLGQVDPGTTYQALLHATAVAAGYLINASFALVPERRLVLDRDRTLLDVAAELFGSVDDRLDDLINTNGFTGAEILELPRGTSVAYYL
jgi:hypothetical protein